jgi:hypothetical protein
MRKLTIKTPLPASGEAAQQSQKQLSIINNP